MKFITTRKIDSFESLARFTADREHRESLARELENESRQQDSQQGRGKRREEEI